MRFASHQVSLCLEPQSFESFSGTNAESFIQTLLSVCCVFSTVAPFLYMAKLFSVGQKLLSVVPAPWYTES